MSFDQSVNPFNQHNQGTKPGLHPKFPHAHLQPASSSPLSPGNQGPALGYSRLDVPSLYCTNGIVQGVFFCAYESIHEIYPCHSFLLLSNIPLNKHTTTCISIHLQMDVWTFSLFDYYKRCYEHMCTSLYVELCFYFSWVNIWKWNGWDGKRVLKFMTNHETAKRLYNFIFPQGMHRSPEALHSHQNLALSDLFIVTIPLGMQLEYHDYFDFISCVSWSLHILLCEMSDQIFGLFKNWVAYLFIIFLSPQLNS